MSRRKIMKTSYEDEEREMSLIDVLTKEVENTKSNYAFIENEDVVMCDVDDTLLMWDNLYAQPHGNTIPVTDPYDGSVNYLTPHHTHIGLLKKYKGRGKFVIVWSAGGAKWARAAVDALGLGNCVNLIMTKPNRYIDDLPANEVLGTRIYLKNLKGENEDE